MKASFDKKEKNNKKVAIICPYPKDCAPSQRLKYEQYLDLLTEKGFSFEILSFFGNNAWKVIYTERNYLKKTTYTLLGYLKRIAFLFSIRKYDILYIHLWVTPIGFPVFEFLYNHFSKKYIYDIDDLIYLSVKSKFNSKIPFLKGRKKTEYLISNANHVISCTPFLDNYAKKFNNNTSDISSTVDTNIYKFRERIINKENIVLGWSGSFSNTKYLYLIEDALQRVSKEYNFTLKVIGDKSFRLNGVKTKSIDWQLESEIKDLYEIDIGLYPLPFEEWVNGKSGLKAIQYMALGIPTIATNIGTINRIIKDGKNGFLINENFSHEWYLAIKQLIEDDKIYKSISKSACKTILEKYSVKVNLSNYLGVFSSI